MRSWRLLTSLKSRLDRYRPTVSLLSQQQVHHPATPEVFASGPAVREDVRVPTARLLQSIREDEQPRVIQRTRRQVTLLVCSLGETDYHAVIPGEDSGGDGDGTEWVAEDAVEQVSLCACLLFCAPGIRRCVFRPRPKSLSKM